MLKHIIGTIHRSNIGAFFHIESGHAYFTHDFLVYSIIGLALIQLFAQAVFFLQPTLPG